MWLCTDTDHFLCWGFGQEADDDDSEGRDDNHQSSEVGIVEIDQNGRSCVLVSALRCGVSQVQDQPYYTTHLSDNYTPKRSL